MSTHPYIGRFAPSPTGPLHIGSLIAAVASYLDARANQGAWKLRIDDIDAARCKPVYAEQIKTCLQNFGLQWDGEATHQQVRALDSSAYAGALQLLADKNKVYACVCSRKEIADSALFLNTNSPLGMPEEARYSGVCRHLNYAFTQPNVSLRLNVANTKINFTDLIQGDVSAQLDDTCGDFILKRRDGLFAYQLAVVVDDYLEGITHIVRGADLLDSTPRQIYLQQLLGYATPHYAHLPVALSAAGEKLSKQTKATALPLNPSRAEANATLILCLQFLGQSTHNLLQADTPVALLAIAGKRWQQNAVPAQRGLAWTYSS